MKHNSFKLLLNNKNHPENKKKNIIKAYDASSPVYDSRYGQIQKVKFELIPQNFNFEGKLILDAGCGTGLFFDYMKVNFIPADAAPKKFIGVDISKEMINLFSIKLEKEAQGVQKRVHLINADAENMPIKNKVIDVVVSYTMIQNLPDLKEGLKEITQMSKEGGLIILTILKKKCKLEEISGIIRKHVKLDRIITSRQVEDYIFVGRKQEKRE